MIRIVSGGQTGVDRASLDAAIVYGLPHCGWCPKGRLAEDGAIERHYNLVECSSVNVNDRTYLNVILSDAVVVMLEKGIPLSSDGTGLTINICNILKKPLLIFDLKRDSYRRINLFIEEYDTIRYLNISGFRGSVCKNAYPLAFKSLVGCFSLLRNKF